MLNTRDLAKLSKFEYSVEDHSLTSQYFRPYWNDMQSIAPVWLAPNVISIVGFFLTIIGWIVCENYFDNNPIKSSLVVVFCWLTYMNLDAVDGIHARITKNSSPMGELIDHGCDSMSIIFITMTACRLFGVYQENCWYIAATAAIGFQFSHVVARIYGHLSLGRYTGPSELIIYLSILALLDVFEIVTFPVDSVQYLCNTFALQIYFLALFGITVYISTQMPFNCMPPVYIFLNVLNFFKFVSVFQSESFPTNDTIIMDCLLISLTSVELIVTKMKDGNPTPYIFAPYFVSFVSKYVGFFLTMAMMINYLFEISTYMKIPIFTQRKVLAEPTVIPFFPPGHPVTGTFSQENVSKVVGDIEKKKR